VITAVINFNIGANVRNLVLHKEKTLSEQVIKEVESEGGKEKKDLNIQKERIREILKRNTDETNQRQKEVKANIENEIKGSGSLKKKEIKEIIEKASVGGRRIDQLTDFEFEFNFFGLR
ncbi:18431_t:CDS:1, partial [Funneliformis geosporum]